MPLLEAPNERRRKVVGVVSGLLLVEVTQLSLSLSMIAFELWSLLSLGISHPPTPSTVSIVGRHPELGGMRSHTLVITVNLGWIIWQTDEANTAARAI